MNDIAIAQVVHAAMREYSAQIGEAVPPMWVNMPTDVQNVVMQGISIIRSTPNTTSLEIHDSWLKGMLGKGWTHGAKKCGDLRTHPCMVSYDELPEVQRVKDDLFRSIVLGLV